MSISYIVDGYNVIKGASPYDELPLRRARERFFSYLETERPHGSERNRLIIVFDGSAQVVGCIDRRNFEIIFTSGESADERIKQMVREDKNPKNIVVVTNDRDLGYAVRRQGARIMSCAEFLKPSRAAKKEKRAAMSEDDSKKVLNIVQCEKITEECRKIWLRPVS